MKLRTSWCLLPGILLVTSFSGICVTADTKGREAGPSAIITNRNVVQPNVAAPSLTRGKKADAVPKVMFRQVPC
jgi:hypothetical protein